MKNILSKIVSSTFVVGSMMFVQAQKADTKSTQILDKVSTKYKANKNTYFKFTYGSGTNGKISKNETGIFYTTPSQYKLKIMDIEQIFDGNKVYNISSEDQEVTIAKGNGSEMMFSPTNYLNNYKKEYNASYVGKKVVAGKSTDQIKLVPVKNNGLKEVHIFVDSAKNQLVKVEQFSSDNTLNTITIQDYRVNQKLDPKMFTFQKNNYKNYLITEL